MKNMIKLLLSEGIHITLYTLACIVPKTKNRWVFGAWFGKTYNDNSKYLFEYINKFESSIKAVWITRNPEVKKHIRGLGYSSFLTYEPLGIWHMLTAQVALFCQNKQHDLAGDCIGPQTKLIQLWHGFSYKKYLGTNPIRMPIEKPHKFIEKIILFFARILLGKKYTDINDLPYRVENWHSYTMICALSERHKKKFLDVYDFHPDEIQVVDYARNDGMFDSSFSSPFTKYLDSLKKQGARIGYCMPTFRTQTPFVPDILLPNISILADYCSKNNIHIFFKLHQNDTSSFKEQIAPYINFHLISNQDIKWDLYPTLMHTDFVMTDYSSIVSDYVLLKKPIIFIPFDKSNYMRVRGLYPDYETLTKGRTASNWTEVLPLLAKIPQSGIVQNTYSPHHFSKKAFALIRSHI